MTKIVFVSTSAAKVKDHLTGLWLEELAVPYYQFKSLGYEVVVASPAGGPIPIDSSSMKGDFFNDDCKKFMVSEAPNEDLVNAYEPVLYFKESIFHSFIRIQYFLSSPSTMM